MDKFELCIRQYGQAAGTYAERGIIVGDVCLLPEFGFSSVLLEAFDQLSKSGLTNGYHHGICDVKIFAKPKGYSGFDKELIGRNAIASLFDFCMYLYPEDVPIKLDEYWDEADIYQRAEKLDRVTFSSRIREMFGYQGYPEGDEERGEQVERFISAIRPELFADASDKITLYCMVDDNDEHCRFAPYIFVGKGRCFLVVARGWEL